MSSTENQNEVATQRADDGLSEKEKVSAEIKSDSSPHKRPASEILEDGDSKKKAKVDHKDNDKENGEDKYDEADGEEDEDDVVPEDYEDEDGEDGPDEDEDDEDDA